jgi:heat shock protein HslJ
MCAAVLLLSTGVTGCGTDEPAADPAALENTLWEVVQYATETGMAEPSLLGAMEGRTLTLELSSEGGFSGMASGNAGVNTFSGPWSATDDGAFQIGPLATTRMAGPESLMRQEKEYLAALGTAQSFAFEGENLNLLDADGDASVSFRPGTPVTVLEGTWWQCTGFNRGGEAFLPVISGSAPTTQLQSGRLSGNAGLKNISGSYELDGNSLAIEAMSQSTDEDAPVDLLDQESAYLEMLGRVAWYKIVGETLTFYDAEDVRLAIFEILPT